MKQRSTLAELLSGVLQPSRHPVSLKAPLKVLMSLTDRGPLGDIQETNRKTDNLTRKFYFESNSLCMENLFQFFYHKKNIPNS